MSSVPLQKFKKGIPPHSLEMIQLSDIGGAKNNAHPLFLSTLPPLGYNLVTVNIAEEMTWIPVRRYQWNGKNKNDWLLFS